MSHYGKGVCPLDCYDSCVYIAEVTDGRITKIKGDPDQPMTGGFTCPKAAKQMERLNSPDRLKYPLLKKTGGWQKITWDEAYGIMAEKLTAIREQYGPTAVLHIHESGWEGTLRALEQRFFNAFGGASTLEGSLCWGALCQAQKYDFGAYYCHSYEDLVNAQTIILWGRNPAATNLHLIPYLKKAKKKGARVILIDPAKTKTAEFADIHIAPRPGTDGALALGLAYIIMEERWVDFDFVGQYTYGFKEFALMVKDYHPARVVEITGVSEGELRQLAREYACSKPAAIYLGYGFQRYTNSGQAVRAINALGALTGNIGIAGGGVNHAHQYNKVLFNSIAGNEITHTDRIMRRPVLAQDILDAQDPPIKAILVNAANPVNQLPNTTKVKEAFNSVEFKVVADFFLTDTADMADLVLPVAGLFEKIDVRSTSWNPIIGYNPKLVDAPGEAKADYEIYGELARRMGLEGFPSRTADDWLEIAVEPLKEFGITLAALKEGPVMNPLMKDVAWQDKKFLTPSGKFEFYSQLAEKDGLNPLPEYTEPAESPESTPEIHREYPLHLLSSHHPEWLHSQFYNLQGDKDHNLPLVKIHPATAEKRYIHNNDQVIVESLRGQVRALACLTSEVRPDCIIMYEGSWLKEGGGVNLLTADRPADMGLGTPYNDCLCQVNKVMID